ncbi:penicillin-binding transpeptidase domain-containing protein, partial [Acidimicrobiaceae bacterium]|nr:penicillin-binding transpeptidase domain-containing protein [Acidimicrobiaceae bacterium]
DSRSPTEIDCGYPCAPDGVGTNWVVRNYGTSITADRYINKIAAQDRAIELQCIGTHIDEIKNKDFIEQFPLAEGLDDIEEESDKLLEIGKTLNQFDEEGVPIIYSENENIEKEENQTVVSDELLIDEQSNLIQIDLEAEKQYIFKPCQDKSEYNRSIKLLDTSGMVSLEEATRRSINTVFAQLASEIGGEKLASTAKRIGIDSELEPVISLTLGAGAVTPIELASAYSSFATNGKLAPPYLIEKIEDSNGQLLYKHIVSTRTSIPDPAAAAAVRKTLEVAAQIGTGTRAVLDDRPIAGKTGTHQGFREAWFIGFIPQYTSSVWIGFAEEQLPLTDVEINGELIKNVSGGRVPAPIWKEFMEEVVKGLPIQEWPEDPIDIDRYGVLELEGTKIINFIEKPKDMKYGNNISLGVYCFHKKDIKEIKNNLEVPCSFEKNVFPELAKNNLLDCFSVNGNMLDVGTRESYIYAHTENKSNWISESATIGKDTVIENSVILGSSSIGNNVQVNNSIICSEAIIEDKAVINDEIFKS